MYTHYEVQFSKIIKYKMVYQMYILLIFMFSKTYAYDEKQYISFHESGTYTIANSIYGNAKYILFEIWGAGGAGGYTDHENCDSGRGCVSTGGGAGAYAKIITKTLFFDEYQIFELVIGKRGIYNTTEKNGGYSLVHNKIRDCGIVANGGLSGYNHNIGIGGNVTKYGDNCMDTIVEISGQNGSHGITVPSNVYNYYGGNGGSSSHGSGGIGAQTYSHTSSGTNGIQGGGGGGSACRSICYSGGNGGDGFISVMFLY